MRLLYRALRVLSDEWSAELREASSELAVTAYSRDLDSVTKTDVPVAVKVATHAKYFTLVLDETPKSGMPRTTGSLETVRAIDVPMMSAEVTRPTASRFALRST